MNTIEEAQEYFEFNILLALGTPLLIEDIIND